MYTEGIYVIKLLFLFPLLICLLLPGCLSQEPRRVEKNHFFPSYQIFTFLSPLLNQKCCILNNCQVDLLAVQGSQESSRTSQFKSINSLALSFLYSFHFHSALHSAFSHPYMTTGKTIALTRWTFVGKVMSLLFNMLTSFSFVIAFLPRSKHLLISWLQSPSAVILGPKKIKSLTVSIVSSSICHEVMGLDAMILLKVEF